MPKRETKNATTVDYAAGEEKLAMFGWCLTGHHDLCIVNFPRHKCACQCHESGKIENHE